MSKRRRNDDPANLSGGTGDVNPQWIGAIVIQSAANIFTEVELPLPVPRSGLSVGENRGIVIEVLKIMTDLTPGALGIQDGVELQITTQAVKDRRVDPDTQLLSQWETVYRRQFFSQLGNDCAGVER